jgi:hypothetical protein
MRKTNQPPANVAVNEADVRDYAYHLYVQRGREPGHELDNWLEAEACLQACIPKDLSHTRLHRLVNRVRQVVPAPSGG